MTAATITILASALLGQPVKADERLEFMKTKAAEYRFERDGDPKARLILGDEPAFRLGKQGADTIEEGAIFLWKRDDGRPEAAVQIFFIKDSFVPDGLWIHEFISLSESPFSGVHQGTPSWSPQRPGLEFRPVPDAGKPAATAAQRGRQMRDLARQFQVSDKFKEKTWDDLRLLPTPVARYGKEGGGPLDGALFAFAMGTDPEAFLFLEARAGKDGPEWAYALAPMTCFDLKGRYKGREVWDLPFRRESKDPALPYFSRTEQP